MSISRPSARPRLTLERIIEVPAGWTCVSGHFGVHFFEGHLPIEDMDRMESTGVEWHRRRPGKLVELTVILPSDARMTSEERTRMTQLIRRWERDRLASATVILADGLRGALQRSVLTGLLLVVPPPHPAKIFGAIPDAVSYLMPYAGRVLDGGVREHDLLAAVLEAYEGFRRRAR